MKKQFQSVAVFAALAMTACFSTSVLSQETPNYKAPTPNPPKEAKAGVGSAAANRYTQALITRMDVNRNGTVTKEEFLKFMESEFNALDKDKNGFLETTEMLRKEMFNRVVNE